MLYGLTAVPRCDTEMCWALNKNQGKIACPDDDLDTMYISGADLREGCTGLHILPPLEMTCGSLHDYIKSVVTLQLRHSLVVHPLLSKILDPPVRVQAEKISSILAILSRQRRGRTPTKPPKTQRFSEHELLKAWRKVRWMCQHEAYLLRVTVTHSKSQFSSSYL